MLRLFFSPDMNKPLYRHHSEVLSSCVISQGATEITEVHHDKANNKSWTNFRLMVSDAIQDDLIIKNFIIKKISISLKIKIYFY